MIPQKYPPTEFDCHEEIDRLRKKISDAQELIPYFIHMGDAIDEECGGRDFNYDENISRLKKALK